MDLEQIQAEAETRAALVEVLSTDASYLCFELLGAQPQLELYAELREALAAAHDEAIAGLGPRGPRPPWCARPSLIQPEPAPGPAGEVRAPRPGQACRDLALSSFFGPACRS